MTGISCHNRSWRARPGLALKRFKAWVLEIFSSLQMKASAAPAAWCAICPFCPRRDMLVGILFKLERGFASDSCRIVPVDVSVAIRQAGKFTPSM
ncbi:hypothetical protein [Sinorhizobium meliloti]|uniref:hypothetical protein n=1 Tax=Rhizobium meliloti TaxID=382 RepID=UPI0012967D47|nr:hypothetical protein [Sinorhizobium meliloti]MQU80808.1 hypothetical protein [Sinorhizobium meliloti]MQU88377.1 hypothetical protein [Sinorhizobium meliloti]